MTGSIDAGHERGRGHIIRGAMALRTIAGGPKDSPLEQSASLPELPNFLAPAWQPRSNSSELTNGARVPGSEPRQHCDRVLVEELHFARQADNDREEMEEMDGAPVQLEDQGI
uniref:Uncharacterized protein n=1 Tax=Globodera pallida TaxID=36090 RepID=A0A183CT11_GLOPA